MKAPFNRAMRISLSAIFIAAGGCSDREPATAPVTPPPPPPPVEFAELSTIDVVFGDESGLYITKGSGEVKDVLATGDFRRMAISPDGNRVAYVRGDAAYISGTDGTNAEQVMMRATGKPSWSPDGTRVVISTAAGLYIVDAAIRSAHAARQITDPQILQDAEPAWSPDGKTIAFTRYDPDWGNAILAVNANDGTESQLPKTRVIFNNMSASSPVWSPDGSRVAFLVRGFIYMMNADGTGSATVRLVSRAGTITSIDDWSRDNKWIAYAVSAADHFDTYLSDFDGRSARINYSDRWGASQLRKVNRPLDPGGPASLADTAVFMGGTMYYVLYPDGRFTLRSILGYYDYWGFYKATGRRLTLSFDQNAWHAVADLLGPSFIVHPGAAMKQFDFTDETYTYVPGGLN